MTDAPLPDRIERLSSLAQALGGAPSQQEIARLLGVRIFDAWNCRGVLFFRPESSGALRLAAFYGYDDEAVELLSTVPFDHESPLHHAMSADEIMWYPDPVDVKEAVGDARFTPEGTEGLIVMPVTHVGVPEQVVVLSFAEPLPSNPASEPFVNAVRSLLELHTGGSESVRPRPSVRSMESRGVVVSADDLDLTDRQMRILTMMAQGRTNRSIAAELGFSESTVRQETLRLYRALEVNSRTDAVSVASRIGLLSTS